MLDPSGLGDASVAVAGEMVALAELKAAGTREAANSRYDMWYVVCGGVSQKTG